MIALLSTIIAPGQDNTLDQRLQHPPRLQEIVKGAQHPRRRRPGRAPQVSPRGRDHQMAAVRQHQDQLQPAAPAHPPHQLKRTALPRMPRPHDPHPRRKAIEVGSVSRLPLTAFSTTL
jgi:hypothetical protein